MSSQNINRRNFLRAAVAIALAPGAAMALNLKLTPQGCLVAEQRVLGGLMVNNEAWKQVSDVVKESDFYRASYQRIYQHLMDLFDNDKPADLLTVAASLARSGNLEQVGGEAHLFWLASEHGYHHNLRRWAEIVSERAHMRNQEARRAETHLSQPATIMLPADPNQMRGALNGFLTQNYYPV